MQDTTIYKLPPERIDTPDTPNVPSDGGSLNLPETPTPTAEATSAPATIEDIIAGLRSFGIEENEEILTFRSSNGRTIRLRITNMPTDEEIRALIAAEEYKGYAWVQRIRVEILSHSISWIDGVDIRTLRSKGTPIKDADGMFRDIQIVLRNIIMGWGQELVMTLWKIAMVHSDKIEKRYQSEFPDSTLMTDVERRFMENVLKEIEDSNKDIIVDSMQQMLDLEKEDN